MCWLFCVCVIFFTFATSDSTLIDKLSKIKWHCADENCSAPISEGYGLRLYNGDDPIKLNFNQNDHFLILGKTNDDKFDQYWLVQAGDRKGIVPVQFVRERKVIINKVNQIETELDLSSIIRPIENERTANEAIKPSSPSLVIDGTTLPPYDEDPISLEAIVEDYSEEVDYESYSEPQAKENPLFGAFGGPGPIPSDSLETDANQNANYTGTGEGFNSDKVASIDSGNVDDVKDSTKSQSDNESSGIQNSIDEKSSGTEASQDLVSNEVGTVHVGSVSENSQDQNVVINSEISSDVNETESNQALAGDVKVESTAENVTYNFNNVVEEKKVDSLEDEKKDPVNVLTNTQNFDASNEPQPTVPPQQPIEQYSTTADQQLVSEKENPLNAEAHITQPPTAEVLRTESPVSSNVVTLTEQAPPVEGIQLQSASPDQNIPPILETITPAVEVAVVPQSETGSRIETYSPSPQPESPLSDSEQDKESVPVSPSEVRDSYVDQLSHPGDGLLSSFTPPIRKDEQPVPEVPSPTVPSLSLHTSYGSIPTENIQPIISPELPTSSIPVSSMPASDPTAKYDSPIIPNIYNQVNSNEDYSLNDTGSSVDENHLSPEQENLITSTEGYVAGTVSELPIVDPQVLNQPRPEESVPETIPTDNSVKEDKDGEDNSAYITQTDELANVIQEGEGWFSGISSVMGSFTEMFSKSDIGVDREDVKTSSEEPVTSTERSESQESGGEEKHCFTESCGQQSTNNEAVYNESNDPGYVSAMFGSFFPESEMSFSTFLCMIITSVVVLLFSLGYYYLENLKQDTSLVSKINTVSTELFFAQKELASIEEQYQLANENYRKLVSETSNNETAIVELRKELEESKAARGALEDEIKRLEKEIESLVEEGDEMHRMLAESFSEEERTKSLLANISDLKSVLSDRLQEIVSLTEQLDKEKQEVELLTISLKKSEEKREATEDKLTKVLIDADSKTLAVTKEFEEKITTLERIIEERSLERTNFEKQICELKGTCESLVVEKELAEKELKKAHGVSSGKALSEWLEAKSIRTDLLTAQKEAEKLSEALEQAKNQGALLEEKEKQLLNQIEELNNKYESAEKDKIEALTKLQVLSNYFKEKEIQLQEELGIKESQWLQKQSEDHTIYEQMRSLREENLSYKAQNEALKKEIIDQEASFKIQIANEEQKAQENWINLRHTERRLKEVQMEASHLRSRLTALEANPDSLEDKHKSLEMVNGDVSMGAASPPFMLYPPPDYIPPPPLVSPTRPPPLGRLSSPPLTPPAPLSPFEFYPPPPASPPPPLRVHKPQPREPHRKQKDSQSSNHSSESTEKPIRRGKR